MVFHESIGIGICFFMKKRYNYEETIKEKWASFPIIA
jgi:hypothetical protein